MSVTSTYATAHLEDLVADVASRLDRIIVTSSRGPTVLFSSSDFVGIVDAARVVLDVVTIQDAQPDAGATTGEGDRISELRDTDSGAWHVVTSRRAYVLALPGRSAYFLPRDTEPVNFFGPRHELALVARCRVGLPLHFVFREAPEDEGRGSPPNENVLSITRLDDYSF
jgi:hypothetical protein